MYKVDFSEDVEGEIINKGFNSLYITSLVLQEIKKQGIEKGDIILPLEINGIGIMFLGEMKGKTVRIFSMSENVIVVEE